MMQTKEEMKRKRYTKVKSAWGQKAMMSTANYDIQICSTTSDVTHASRKRCVITARGRDAGVPMGGVAGVRWGSEVTRRPRVHAIWAPLL